MLGTFGPRVRLKYSRTPTRLYRAVRPHERGIKVPLRGRVRPSRIIRGTASRGSSGGHFWLLIHPMVDPDGPMGPIVGNGGTRDLALTREYDYEYLDAIMIYILQWVVFIYKA